MLFMNTDIFRLENKEGTYRSQNKKDNMICFIYLSEWINTERNKMLHMLIQQPKKEVQRTLLCRVKSGRVVIHFLTLIACGEKKKWH